MRNICTHACIKTLPILVIDVCTHHIIHVHVGIDFIKEEKISLTSLMKLEHGYNVPVLSSLKGDRLWKLKDKAVFDLKFNERNGCDEPAVNLYISSWLEDKDAGCPPTWNNLVVLLREVDLEEIAKNVLAIVASNNLISLSDLRITAGRWNKIVGRGALHSTSCIA